MKKVSDQYKQKINSFIISEIKNIKNPNIIEFGVRFGVSTNMFLEVCEKSNGFLYSVDIEDCSTVAKSDKWKFFKTRDDNFQYLDNVLPNDVDLIYLDSFHNAEHIKKIFYHYFKKLKVGGFFVFDDISWLPYLKANKRNNFNCEINNLETFKKILEIHNQNNNILELSFNFDGSGLAKIKKLNEGELDQPKKIKTREFSLKNFFRKIKIFFQK